MIATKRLWKVIDTSLQEKKLDKLNEYLSKTDITVAFNFTILSNLMDVLKKNQKSEDNTVFAECVLSCLRHFVDKQFSPIKWEVMADHVAKLCDLVLNISAMIIKDEHLIGENITTLKAIINHRKVVSNNMLCFTMGTSLKVVTDDTLSNAVRMELLSLISLMMSQSTRETRSKVIPLQIPLLNNLSNKLPVCGDYEMQVSIVDVLARSWYFLRQQTDSDLFTNFPNVMEMFKSFKFLKLDSDCRLFLNDINNGMGDDQSVYSIPCLAVLIDQVRCKKPSDPTYKEFWVDFNVSSKSISFYYQADSEEVWGLRTFFENDIVSATAVNSACKAKSGEATSAVKIEITLKPEEDGPRLLKIYARKCKEYQTLEKRAMNKQLKDKYKSTVTYDELSPPNHAELTGLQRNTDSDESKLIEEDTSVAMNPTVIYKGLNESGRNDLGKVCTPSPGENEIVQERNVPQESISFSHYIKQMQNQEHKATNKDKNETYETKDSGNKNVNTNFINGIEALGRLEINPPVSEEIKINETINQRDNLLRPEKNKFVTPKRSSLIGMGVSEKRRRLFSNETNNEKDLVMSSQEECSFEDPNYKLCVKEERKMKPVLNRDRSKITYSYISEKEKENSRLCNLSSLFEDGVNNEEKEQESTEKEQEKCVTGKTNQFPVASTPYPNHCSDKKLLALNASPDDLDNCNIFPSTSLFPNHFASGKDTHFKKTYARPKAKPNRRNISFTKCLPSSDSDSDYVPIGKVSPVVAPRKSGRKGGMYMNLNLESFVKGLPHRPDPIRDIELNSNDEIAIDPAKVVQFIAPREIEVGPPVQPVSDVPKKGRKRKNAEVEKQDVSKIIAKKLQKGKTVQPRKRRGKKDVACMEKSVENVLHNVPFTLLSGNDTFSQGNQEVINGNAVLEMRSQIFKDSAMSGQSPDSSMVVEKCLTEADTRVRNLLNNTQKERDMYCSAFSFRTHTSVSVLQDQTNKLLVISNQLHQAKSLLDTTSNLQNEVLQQIQKEINQLEESKRLFLENLSNIEQTQPSKVVSMFQELRGFMANFAMSFFQGNKSQPNK